MRLLVVLLLTSIILCSIACVWNDRATVGSGDTTIILDGSSTVYPISRDMAVAYEQICSSVHIRVCFSGTGKGFQQFSVGSIDIANASRPIKETEIEHCNTNGIQFFELPIGYDAIAVVVSRQNTWARTITTKQLAQIWAADAQGIILRWNQIHPDWPDEPLHLFGPDKASGTFDYFTKAINGTVGVCRSDYTDSDDDDFLAEAIAGDPYALGYFGLSYYVANSDRLNALAVDDEDDTNGAGPQMPSAENVLNETYQPLARPLFIYVSEIAVRQSQVHDFVRFYLDNASKITAENQYIPLSKEITENVKRRFTENTFGTEFGGKGAVIGFNMDQLLDLSIEELIERLEKIPIN